MKKAASASFSQKAGSWLLLVSICGLVPASRAADNRAPRIWDAKELSTWATPIAGINVAPSFLSENEYYQLPVDNLRTYPVYHPDREPKGYADWLSKRKPLRLIEPEKIRTETDWIAAGQRVFDELDLPLGRTTDPRAWSYVRDREALRKEGELVSKDGTLPGFRWVIDSKGKLNLGVTECGGCHLRMMADGTLIRGAQGNLSPGGAASDAIGEQLFKAMGTNGKPMTPAEFNFISFSVPWIKNDIHARLKGMSDEETGAMQATVIPGTFPRFNGSIYYITKIPDLIGVKDRLYLDHTGTHVNRGPGDIARYSVLVTTVDDGAIGGHTFLTAHQRRVLNRSFRYSDEAMWALAKFIYSLEPPPNPNKLDALATRGKAIFGKSLCLTCHAAPLYTNNLLIPVRGFQPAAGGSKRASLHVLDGFTIDTDPALALQTRKGTGYYKVPSLKGLWYRRLLEHSGSIGSLEDWFDRKRLREDYVPSGWKGPGVKTRAVKGHEFGLDSPADDKRALIAFLKTL